jgi:hypothetical protein
MMPLDMATKKVYAAGTMQIGDYVQFGKYYGKPILWKVINIDADGSPMLYSEKILCVKPFDAAESGKDGRTGSNPYSNDEDRQRYGSNKWENSNIREWLNSNETKVTYTTQAPTNEAVWDGYNDYADEAGFQSNFSESERAARKPVTHKSILAEIDKGEKEGGTEKHQWNYSIDNVVANYDKAYYKNVTDKVYFLDVKELYDYVYKRNLEYRKMPSLAVLMKRGLRSISPVFTMVNAGPSAAHATVLCPLPLKLFLKSNLILG